MRLILECAAQGDHTAFQTHSTDFGNIMSFRGNVGGRGGLNRWYLAGVNGASFAAQECTRQGQLMDSRNLSVPAKSHSRQESTQGLSD